MTTELVPNAVAAPGGATPTVAAPPPAGPGRRRVLREILRSPAAVIALTFVVLIVLMALFGRSVAPWSYDERDSGHRLSSPSWDHLLGTDNLGRDTFSRLLVGARVSMQVSLSVVGMSLLIAVPVGLLSGYWGGRLDRVVMRITDGGLSFPPLVLALAFAGVMGPGVWTTVIALTVIFTPSLIRLVRGQALAVREETFVEASQSIGTPSWRILASRVFPGVASPVLVQATVLVGAALLAEAGLSYLGLGAQPPTPSWGTMLRSAYDTALFTRPAQVLIPGVAIMLTVLAFNVLGDKLTDAFGIGGSQAGGRKGRRGMTTVARSRRPDAPAESPREPVLQIEGLSVEFASSSGAVRVVDDLHLSIGRGEVLGLVGESGSGKTVTAMSIMRLLPSPPAQIVDGAIWFEGQDLLSLKFNEMRSVRGRRIGMVFQDPMTSLDPAVTIGAQLIEAQLLHRDVSKAEAKKRAVELLDLVRIPHAGQRVGAYPHELSGGMRQRVMIAIALACEPALLIADEPTTALDVTVQAQILDILRSLQREFDMAVLFVTHDLGVIADIADRVAVMYAGQIVETAPTSTLFRSPQHPYTEGLLGAMPRLGQSGDRLKIIRGRVPVPGALPSGCRFHTRCDYAQPACSEPEVSAFNAQMDAGSVRCIRHRELSLTGTASQELSA